MTQEVFPEIQAARRALEQRIDTTSNPTVTPDLEVLLEALSLNHGGGFGRQFFTKMHRDAILRPQLATPSLDGTESAFQQDQ